MPDGVSGTKTKEGLWDRVHKVYSGVQECPRLLHSVTDSPTHPAQLPDLQSPFTVSTLYR